MGDREHHVIRVLESSISEEEVEANAYKESEAAMRRSLEEQKREVETTDSTSTQYIDRFPPGLTGICPKAIEPEIVSIGPHHRDKEKLLEFESYKFQFLESLLCRKRNEEGHDLLEEYCEAIKSLEESTRSCYSEVISMSSPEFVGMMVLDGCFIIELFLQMSKASDVGQPILRRPGLVPIVTRDLLKLQNQLPFFVLEKLFEISSLGTKQPLLNLALEFFNHSLPRPSEVFKMTIEPGEAKHLLHLFHLSFLQSDMMLTSRYAPNSNLQRTLQVLCQVALLPAKLFIYLSRFLPFSRTPYDNDRDSNHKYRPSSESIQCTAQLRPSGIKFMPRRDAESFLDIDFRNAVLRIPPITINDLTIVVFINCMAFERCHQYITQRHRSQRFTAYIAFMSCLINSTRDVRLLCADGIITGFSLNDQYVAEMFTKLGDKVEFNIRNCYLSEQFRDVEAYYSSHWAAFMRTYFSRPWSSISVFTAFIILLLTGVQTVMSILSHLQAQRSKD